MARYATSVEWHDPFEKRAIPHEERRSTRRFAAKLRVSLEVLHPHGRLIGPGSVRDLSLGGATLLTKHDLEPGHEVTVQIPTDGCPDAGAMPSFFTGPARVVRLNHIEGRVRHVALAFGQELLENMDFAVFVNTLSTTTPTSS